MAMHIVLAALTMGLAPLLVWFEAQWLWQKNTAARDALHFWIKIFSLTVAVGAVSGVVMEFQFGTHWAAFSQQTGGIIGPFLFYEVLTAFFLESALTGVMLFGFGRIPPHVHFVVTCMVAFGALLSAFWILAANSWMQTPVGFTQDDAGHFIPESIFLLLKAPSFPWRFSHMVTAALIGSAYFMMGIAAWRLLRFPGEMGFSTHAEERTDPDAFRRAAADGNRAISTARTRSSTNSTKLAAMEGSWAAAAARGG
uniref:Cytochrome ubiquinol oxidase subunit I n=1 Tax=Acyrthosiphon pisum TaxID=7029 RepID=A0A8R2H9F9_ACYPI|eukprot:XP_016664648.1 PREDICTED: cytochrome bd-II ubiquinol oxidase subunit 1-like [Acyrthosiphon pisum]